MTKTKDNHLRFGITNNNGLRAATWTITNPKSKSDIYISCRELRGTIKASLHQSGSWHIGYSKDAVEKYLATDQNKYMEIWSRPNPIALGFTLAFRIVTPYSAVTCRLIESSKDIKWIPNCNEGFATEIDLIITSPDTAIINWPGKEKMDTKLLGSFKLSNEETAWLVYWTVPLPDFSGLSGKQFQFYKGKTKQDLVGANLRAIIFGQEPDDSRTIYDCAMQTTKTKNDMVDKTT
jgi:hypothetical protein